MRETICSVQTGNFPKQSLSRNKYIMIMVNIDSSGILVKPMKSQKDVKIIRAYQATMLSLERATIESQKTRDG